MILNFLSYSTTKMARNTGTGQTAYVYIAVILEYVPRVITFHNLLENVD